MIFRTLIKCILALLALSLVANSSDSEFRRLLGNPRVYNNKRVSLVGFAHVDGESFVLFENERAASKLADSQAVSVAQRLNGPNYDHFNKHWVKVTGVVDAYSHGLWNFPCEILLERVEPAQKPR